MSQFKYDDPDSERQRQLVEAYLAGQAKLLLPRPQAPMTAQFQCATCGLVPAEQVPVCYLAGHEVTEHSGR